jgi:hypothetical protein
LAGCAAMARLQIRWRPRWPMSCENYKSILRSSFRTDPSATKASV